MHECMDEFVCVCTCPCACAPHVCVCVRVCVCGLVGGWVCDGVCVGLHAWYVCKLITYVRMHTCLYVGVCMYVCMYVSIYAGM